MDSIRPLQNYNANIVPQAVLNATLGTVVYASNYNDLDNKPSINSVELRGNKTAGDLGLATPADITVTSVNTQTGDVSLTGQNIPYDSTYSVTEKINDIEAQIVDSGVSSVNGQTGVVILTGSDINYSVGVSLNNKIDAVEGEIPVVNYPVTSVNGETGAVVLAGSDIEYSEGVTVNSKIDTNATNIGDLSSLTTSVQSSLVGAVNEANAYKAGDTITASITKLCAGRSTSVGDKVVFFYPLPKVIISTSARFIISASTAYAWRSDGGPVDLSAGTYTASVTDGGLYIIANLASTVTGNRSMNVELSNRTIEFFNN